MVQGGRTACENAWSRRVLGVFEDQQGGPWSWNGMSQGRAGGYELTEQFPPLYCEMLLLQFLHTLTLLLAL